MPSTLTLKGIPDELYARLKRAAKAHHRSLSSEVIACLGRQFDLPTLGADERLARARRLRAEARVQGFDPEDIAKGIRQGRA